MALRDKLPWLKISDAPPPPRTAAQQLIHLVFSLALLALSLGVVWMVVMSETRRTFSCDEQRCTVVERDGLFAKSLKIASGPRPVSFETRGRRGESVGLLMVDAEGESTWLTDPNDNPVRIKALAAELQAYRTGDKVILEAEGFGIEWYFLGVLLLTSCVLNLRNSIRSLLR